MENEDKKTAPDDSSAGDAPGWDNPKLNVSGSLWKSERSRFSSPEIPKLLEGALPSKLFYNLSEAV